MAGIPLKATLRRRVGLLAAIGVAALLLAFLPGLASKPSRNLPGVEPVKISAVSIPFDQNEPNRTHFGKLIWQRTLTLFANSPAFGGYSALAIDPTGTKLIAISDAGSWLRATLRYDGGYLAGLANATVGPLLGTDGKPLENLNERDSEGFSIASGTIDRGVGYISFEHDHRIQRYPFTETSFGPAGERMPLPPASKAMPPNSGFESVVKLKSTPCKGAILAFAEHLPDKHGNLQGWLIGGPHPGPIRLTDIGGFSITDATTLPDGDLVLLERRFNLLQGIAMRLRLIRADAIRPGALLHGEVLLQAGNSKNIDNMEALGAYRTKTGKTVLTLMSDDNFSPLERNLIMQFVVPDDVLHPPAEAGEPHS